MQTVTPPPDRAVQDSPPEPPAQPPARRLVPAGRAFLAILLALLLASLFCADSLERIAQRQPFGTTRDVELAITKPLHSMSHALFLDRPRQWLEDRAGNGEK